MPSAAQAARSRTSTASPASRGPLRGGVGERGRRQRAGGLVDEIACARDGARGDARARNARAPSAASTVAGGRSANVVVACAAAALVGQVLVEAVGAEQRAFGGDLDARRRGRRELRPTRRTRARGARRSPRAAPRRRPRCAAPAPERRRAAPRPTSAIALRADASCTCTTSVCPSLRAKPFLGRRRAATRRRGGRRRASSRPPPSSSPSPQASTSRSASKSSGSQWRDGELEHGCGRARDAACVRVESHAQHFKAPAARLTATARRQ